MKWTYKIIKNKDYGYSVEIYKNKMLQISTGSFATPSMARACVIGYLEFQVESNGMLKTFGVKELKTST